MRWTILSSLVSKDLTRVRRKPLGYLINICIPLVMTAVVGFIFGPSDNNSSLGVLRMAIVDEDDSIIGHFLGGAVTNPEFQENISVAFLDRETAMETLLDNEISAVLVIPDQFSEQYVKGTDVPPLELIKNPAHRFHPAVIEELLGVVVEGANALYRIAGDDLEDWRAILEDEDGVPDMVRISSLLLRLGDRFDVAGKLLFPPLIQFEKGGDEAEAESDEKDAFNLFGFILPGMAGLFLFFIADNIIRDVYREENAGTLDRYRCYQGSLVPLMISKMIISMLVISASVLLTFSVGILLFGMEFGDFFWMLLYTLVYSFYVTGFIVFLNALAGKEARADAINGIVIFGISFLGGNMIPADQLPAFITETVTRYLPNSWFIRGMHHLQFGWGDVNLPVYSLLLLVIGSILMLLGSRILYGKLERRRL